MMVGRDVGALYGERPIPEHGTVALEVEGLTRRRNARDPNAIELVDVSLKAHQGRDSRPRRASSAPAAPRPRARSSAPTRSTTATIRVDGKEVRFSGPRDAMSHGIGLVPEDRKKQALFLSLAIRTNIPIAAQEQVSRGWFIDERREDALIDEFRKLLSIRMASAGTGGGPAFRRQSAEGRAGALARAQAEDPHRRRADARHRHRLQGRGPQSSHRHGEGRHRGHRHFVGAARNPGGDRTASSRCAKGRVTGEIARTAGDAGNPDGDDDVRTRAAATSVRGQIEARNCHERGESGRSGRATRASTSSASSPASRRRCSSSR